MKLYPCLLVIGIAGSACSGVNSNSPPDLGQPSSDLSAVDAAAAASSLSVIAGGLGGMGSADGTGATARFSNLFGIAVDGAGNLFVTDTNNNTVRKVVLATTAVSTLAGSPGKSGISDGIGAAARLSGPQAVTADGAGNLFVADTGSSTIRKIVVASGAVSTLAGSPGMMGSADGTGSVARFAVPAGVAVDGAGNLFVADTGNNTIRQVNTTTGMVTTLAGTAGMTGSTDNTGAVARFNAPFGAALDGAGNLYIGDAGNSTIRKLVIASGVVTTLAGTAGMSGAADGMGPVARFNTPRGLTVDGVGNLYVADANNRTTRKVVLASGMVTTLAGTAPMQGSVDGTGPAARFNLPCGVAASSGDLYVADADNGLIRKVVIATAVVTTFASTPSTPGTADGTGPTARFTYPRAVAADSAGNVYIADSNNYAIRKVVVATGVVTTLAGTTGLGGSADGTGPVARFSNPHGLALDAAGNLYVSDAGNATIRKVVIATGVVTTIAGRVGMNGSTNGGGTAARFYGPYGLALDGAGRLFVADSNNNTIRAIVLANNMVTTLAGTPLLAGATDGTGAAARFNAPFGLAADGAGNLYVADSNTSIIRKIVIATGVVTTLAGTAGSAGSADGVGPAASFYYPQGVAADGVGNLYVADTYNSTVRKVVLANASVTTIVGTALLAGIQPGPLPGGLNHPAGITALLGGQLFLTDIVENALLAVH